MGKYWVDPVTSLGERTRSVSVAIAMANLSRRTGTQWPRQWLLSAVLAALAAPMLGAQETPNAEERNALDSLRSGGEVSADKVPTEKAKAACDKTARWFAARLVDQKTREAVDNKGESFVVNDLTRRLGLPAYNAPGANMDYFRHPDRKPFVDEFGKALVGALEGPALQNANFIIRINAARMIAEVCRSGYDGAAEPCLKILAKPDENEAVKFYALQGLKNLFFILPNPPVPANSDPGIPEKTVFQKDNKGALSPLEKRCIQALVNYIFRQPADLKPEDVDGLLYVRREAVAPGVGARAARDGRPREAD